MFENSMYIICVIYSAEKLYCSYTAWENTAVEIDKLNYSYN